jgi:hypothetical protein
MAKVFQENVFQNQKAGVVLQKVFQVEDAATGGAGNNAIWLRRRRRMNRELRHRGHH